MQKHFIKFLAFTLALIVTIGTFDFSAGFAATGGKDDVNLLAHQDWDFKLYNDFNQFPKDSGLVKDSDYTTSDDMAIKSTAQNGYQSSGAITTTINSNSDQGQNYFILPSENKGFKSDFTGAKEFWMWVDLSGMTTNFRKVFFGFQTTDGKTYQTDDMDDVSNMAYYIQDSNGNWQEKHFDTDGCIENIGNYKGFLRFSTDYFVLGSEKIDLSKVESFKVWYDLLDAGSVGVGSTFVIDHIGFAGPSMTNAGSKVSDIATNGMLQLPSTLPAQIFDENNVVLRYGAVSDLHVTDETGTAAQKVKSAFDQLKQKAGNNLDAVLAVGDLTDYGKDEHAQALQKVVSSNLDLNKTKFLFTLGNHDYYNHVIGNAPDKGGNLIKQYFGDTVYQGATAQEVQAGDYHTTVNGYDFIMVNCAQYEGGVKYSQSDIDWLSAELAKAQAAHPDHPIFVASHPTITNTTYAGNHAGDYYNSTDLYSTLKNYPQAIYFSGHTHYNLNDEKDIWQGDFTTVGTASVYYGCVDTYTNDGSKYYGVTGDDPTDYMQFSQGLYVEVDKDNNVKLTRMDFYHQKEIKTAWIIPAPKSDKSQLLYYSNARKLDNSAPAFASGAAVQIDSKDINKNEIMVSFDKAQDDDMVSAYRVEFVDKDSDKVKKTIAVYSDFYQYPQPSDMPDKLSFKFSGGTLAPFSADYVNDFYVRVTAIDSWDATSDPINSVTYPGTPVDPNKPVEKAGPELHSNWNFKLYNDFNTLQEGYTLKPNVDYNSWPVPDDPGTGTPQPVSKNGYLSTPAITTKINSMASPFTVYFPTAGHKYKTDFSNAKEFWMWVDFSDVQFRKISIGVRKNDAYGDEYQTDDFDNQTDMKAYIQDGNGGWKAVDFDTDGCLPEFGHYIGFIRFSIDYMRKGDDTLYPDNIQAFKLWFSPSSSDYIGKTFTFDEVGFAGPNMADADGTLTDLMNGNIPANPTNPTNNNSGGSTHNDSSESQAATTSNSTLQTSTYTSGETVATVTTKPDSIPVVAGGRSSVGVTVPSNVDSVLASATSKNPVQVKVTAPTPELLEQFGNSAVRTVNLTIKAPPSIVNNTNPNVHVSINVAPAVIQDTKASQKDITLTVADSQTGKTACTWTFSGTSLKSSAASVTGVDLAVAVSSTDSDSAVSAVAAKNSLNRKASGLLIKFGNNGLLPAPASIRVYVGNQEGCTPNSKVYLYYFNRTTKALEQLPRSEFTVDSEGFVTLTISHCSDYVLLPKVATNPYPVKSDTTYAVGVKNGKTYTFAMTVAGNNIPKFTVGNGNAFTYTVKRQGNRYYYTVKAVGTSGVMTAVYCTLPKQNPAEMCCISTA